jgi:hypothetical protein
MRFRHAYGYRTSGECFRVSAIPPQANSIHLNVVFPANTRENELKCFCDTTPTLTLSTPSISCTCIHVDRSNKVVNCKAP